MTKAKERCEHCGAAVVKYRHSLNAGMVKGLILLDQSGGSSLFKDLKLTFNQKNNFQKLRYWHLIEKKGSKKSEWSITAKGLGFLKGQVAVPKRVSTYRGNPLVADIDTGVEMVTIEEVLADHVYWYREDYLKNRVAWELYK